MDEGGAGFLGLVKRADRAYLRALRAVVLALASVSGLAILAMIAVTCADVALRAFGRPLTGAFDIVRVAGAVAIACALPYTTAVKGHVAIEYFFQKLNRPGRILVDTVCRLLVMGLFSVFTWQCVMYGNSLRRTGEVSLTLQIPMFWVTYVIAGACAVTVLVKIHNLLHPGREMIKP
ncbi:MAG TPA: TRAP transporter small permease [Candidatus Hydrogenedentes bacterium]|nr:TRAP transporter small permease [Candidatus Hydrogenedentota bacterium]